MDLTPIEKASLTVGMRLRANVHDQSGRLLLTADTVLGPNHLNLLKRFPGDELFVCSDWKEPESEFGDDKQSTPAAVIKQLAEIQRKRQSDCQFIERKHERKSWNAVITLVIEEMVEKELARHREIEVTTLDISAGGYAFMFKEFVNPGTVVRARFEGLPNKPILVGVVRNCVDVDATQHRVGVQFMQRSKR